MINENYDKYWLRDIQIHLRAIHHICPDFWVGEDDPDEIVELKKKLHELKGKIATLTSELHDMIDKENEKEKE